MPTTPPGRFEVVSVSVAGAMVMLTGPVNVPTGLLESVTVTDTFDVPATVGVPFTTHPAPRLRPAGKVPDAIMQLYGDVPPPTPMVAV